MIYLHIHFQIAYDKIWTGPLDPWTIGPSDFFGTILGSFLEFYFWTIILGDDIPLVLKKGWDTVYQYSGRGGRQTVVTEGGVGSCCINKCYQLMEFPLDHTNYYY